MPSSLVGRLRARQSSPSGSAPDECHGCGRLSRVVDRVLTVPELNRAVLARQLLLERSTLPVPSAVEAVAGLQTQYAPSGYVALWSRLDGFRRADLTDALHTGTVVQ